MTSKAIYDDKVFWSSGHKDSVPEVAWKIIPGFELRYEASNVGIIRNRSTARILTHLVRNEMDGYYSVTLTKGKKHRAYHVHQLVAETFLGPRPGGYQTHHIDHNPKNNAISNLEYVSPKDHRAKHSKSLTSVSRDLGEGAIIGIKTDYPDVPLWRLVEKYGATRATVINILKGKVAKGIGPDVDVRDGML